MDVAKVGQIVLTMLLPTLAVGTAIYLPRGIRAVRRLVTSPAQPSNPPIEKLAADLRRLLRQHEALHRSTDVARRAVRLRALEGAIADCAIEAARALQLPYPQRPARGVPAAPELRRLLHALVDAGLVLPPAIGLLARDARP